MRKYIVLSVCVSTLLMAGGEIKPVGPEVGVIAEPDYGEIFGQSRTFYIDRSYTGTLNNNRNALATGGYVGYKSPVINGLGVVAAAYGTYGFKIHDISAEDDWADNHNWNSYEPSLTGLDGENYVLMGQAYIQYAFGHTDIKVGRQNLDTPMVGADDARMLPNLFEAAVISNTDIEDTTLILTHITRETVGTFGNIYAGTPLGLNSGYGLGMNAALSGNFVNMGKVALGEGYDTDGVTAAAVVYKGLEGLTLTAWDYVAYDILNTVYLQAEYGWKCRFDDRVKMNASAQYITQSDVGDTLAGRIEGNYWGAKIGAGFGALSTYAAYSQTDDSDWGIITPWGGMPAYTQGMVTRHQFFANTDTWKVAAAYSFTEYGVNTSVFYAEFDIGSGNIYDPTHAWTASESGWEIYYDVASIKGLSLKARANYPKDFKEGLDWDEYRLIANYNF